MTAPLEETLEEEAEAEELELEPVVEPEPDEEPDEDPVEVAEDPEPVVVLLDLLLPVAEEDPPVEVDVELVSSEVVAGQVKLKRGVDDSLSVMANFWALAPLSSTKLYQKVGTLLNS